MCEIARKDKIKNTDIQEKLGVAQINDKMRENRAWYIYVQRRPINSIIKRIDPIKVERGKYLRRAKEKIANQCNKNSNDFKYYK